MRRFTANPHTNAEDLKNRDLPQTTVVEAGVLQEDQDRLSKGAPGMTARELEMSCHC